MKKHYIFMLLFIAHLVMGQIPTGSSTEVGITEGQLSVSLTGGANYSIPIAVPPGINGVVPQVGLVYNSQGGNGIAGYGWNISGVSAITRIPRTKFHDGVVGGVNLDGNDRFALDGQRLILKTGSSYGAAGTTYETENFSNLKITAIGVSPLGANYGPATFKVEYPDGSVAYYGNDDGSRSITTWSISQWENSQAVRISYSYIKANNNLNIEYIKYGSIGAATPINKIQFLYDPSARPEQAYVGGQSISNTLILKQVKVLGNSVGFRNYGLLYKTTELNYQQLEKITETSGDSTKSYNPTKFIYGETLNKISFERITTTNTETVSAQSTESISGDFDGDGFMDYVLYPKTKGKFTLYNNLKDPIASAIVHTVNNVYYSDIFASNCMTATGVVLPFQGITTVRALDKGNVIFKTFAFQNGSIQEQYSTTVTFETYMQPYGCIPTSGGGADSCRQNEVEQTIKKRYLSGDFNGDGLIDVMAIEYDSYFSTEYCDYNESNECYSYFAGGYRPKQVYFVDLKRDASTNLDLIGWLQNPINYQSDIRVLDFNGDGKSDFMVRENGSVLVYSMNEANNQLVLLTPKINDSDINLTKILLVGDYNGDGKSDFLIPKFDQTQFVGDDWYKYTSTGTTFIKEAQNYPQVNYQPNTPNAKNSYYIPMDFDNDGKTDLVGISFHYTITRLAVAYNRNGTFSFVDSPGNNSLQTVEQPGFDWLTLPIFYNSNQPNRKLEIAAMRNGKILYFHSDKDFSKEKLLNTITTGNGVKEIITYNSLINDNTATSLYKPVLSKSFYPNIDIATAPSFQVVSMLEKQSASVNKKQLFAYAGATSNMQGLGFLGFRATMRTNWFENNNQIISSISKFDPDLRGANVENHTYLGRVSPEALAKTNTLSADHFREQNIVIDYDMGGGTELLQATKTITFEPGTTLSAWLPVEDIITAEITPDFDGHGYADTNTSPPSGLISRSLLFYDTGLSPTKVYTLQNTLSKNYNILDNTSSETDTSYDGYSNPVESVVKLKNAGAVEQTTITTIGYAAPLAASRPASKSQTVTTSGDSMTTKETYTYGSGTESNLLKKIEKWGHNTSSIIEENVYDGFGNITRKTITAGSISRITNYEYNPASPYNGRFLTKSYDVETLPTTFDYNPNNGLLNSETNPYNLTTTYIYNDPWFKKTKTTDYLGKSNTYTYTRSDNVNTLVTTTGDDGSYSEELFDDLGRKTVSGVKDITGAISKVSYEYDIYDRNYKVSEPYFGTGTGSQWSETHYDVYGRVEETQSFAGKIVNMSYQGLTTTINDGSKTKVSVKNAIGNVVSVTDTPGGTINYTYFANGNLKETSYLGNTIKITQDGWGRKTELSDPSAGIYTYEYNALGETTKEITPNGKTTYILDPSSGKLTGKTIEGLGTSSNNTNSSTMYSYNGTTKLLESSTFTNTLEGNAITTTYTYDGSKRLTGTTEVTPYATFSKQINSFDAFGRVETETTSATANGKTSSKTIKNTYKNSYPWQILDNATQQVLWQTNTVNARGQLLTASLGNGIAITNTYDQYGFATQFKHDKTGSSTDNVMVLGTVFDPQKGNLSSRTNNLFGTSDTFTYDSLDRLISYPNATGATVTQNYYADGRIKDNTIGTYNYANTAKKYQNTSVTLTPDALTYYQNRGIAAIPSPTATRALAVTYNTFKSPVEITEDGIDKISFVYNDNNDRSAMFYGSLDVDKNLRPNRKYYSADGSMEIKQNILTGVNEFVTYIGGDGYSAPIVLKSDGTTQNYLYLHRDYQGSILAITDANAVVLEKRLFDAWGAILQVQDGAGNPLNGLTILDRGYTGHEHLQSVGLIHMNGRLYDAKLHRFLQPDNYVQDPSNTQNYNRYGYCWNNPLKFTDPSGEWINIVIGAAVGGIANWIVNGAQFNAKGLAYFGVGAAAGALTAMGAGGVSSLLGGGTFSAGALGTSAAAVAGSGFASGAVIGAAGGLVGGFATGLGNGLVDGKGIGDSFKYGIRDGGIGAITGGIIGGIGGGIKASNEGTNFWTGEGTTEFNENIASAIPGEEQTYSNESAKSFRDSHEELNRLSSSYEGLYADGSVPDTRYTSVNGYINGPRGPVNGVTSTTGVFRKDINIYLSKSAFVSREQLYLTMHHESMHAYFNCSGLQLSNFGHDVINNWAVDQAAAWGGNMNIQNTSSVNLYSQYGFKIINYLP